MPRTRLTEDELFRAPRGRWRVRDGSFVDIRAMGDGHLQRATRIVERCARAELVRIGFSAGHFAETTGGDMAADAAREAECEAFDIAFDQDDRTDIEDVAGDFYPKYRELVRELDRRSLPRLDSLTIDRNRNTDVMTGSCFFCRLPVWRDAGPSCDCADVMEQEF